VKKFGQAKKMGQASATALVAVALVFVAANAAIASGQTSSAVDSTTPVFTITSTISSSPTSQIAALLYPGSPRYLWYTVQNTASVAITVNSLSISGVSAPFGCPSANLDLSLTTFSGSLVVPANQTNSVSVPISLINTSKNQDTCQNTTFDFAYSGSAAYTEVYATTTAVTSPTSPSPSDQAVTYTAAVTADATGSQDSVPSSPTGTVTFLDGNTAICLNVPVSSTGTTTSTAACLSSVYAVAGTHLISAVYSNSDGNFSSSTSPVLSQVSS
jgi:hypothetical protein